jgi:hypothetical protein
MTDERNRATDQEMLDRVAHAAQLKLSRVPVRLAIAELCDAYGVSIKTARRYLALAAEEIKDELPASGGRPIDDALAMAAELIAKRMARASTSDRDFARLADSLIKLRGVMASEPCLSDVELLNRAAYAGGRDALAAKSGQEPWRLNGNGHNGNGLANE